MEPKGMSTAPVLKAHLELSRVPPSATDIEDAVLGALLIEPHVWPKVADRLHRDLFYLENNRAVFDAMWCLYAKGHPVDLVTVASRLRSEGTLEGIGGPYFLTTLTNRVASSANIEYHVTILTDKLISRRLVVIGNKAVRMGYEHPEGLDALDNISSEVTDLYSLTQPTRMTTAADGVEELIDRRAADFLTFGIPALDKVATFAAGVPSVFAGRPGIGKSIFGLEVLWHNTLRGPVLGFFPEMTRAQVQARILARESGVPYSRILRRAMSDRDMELVTSTLARIGDRMKLLKVDDTSGVTPDQVRARVERAVKAEGVVCFAVDHLHKMRTGNNQVDRRDFDRVGQCMNGVTEVAKRTNLPCLVMCQLNRGVESRGAGEKRPKLSDLRSTGEIEQDAALVGLLYRDGYYSPEPPEVDRLEIGIAKNRDGAVGDVITGIRPAINYIGDDLATTPGTDATPF